MNALDLLDIAQRHGIRIEPDPADPANAGYVITEVRAMHGVDLTGLPEHPEVVEFKAWFPRWAAEIRSLMVSWTPTTFGPRLDDGGPSNPVVLPELSEDWPESA